MSMNIQPVLENEKVILMPLQEEDFKALYQVASDPSIWQQHPNKNRWQREVFRTFFEGALLSKGAFKIIDKASGEIIGSTRFYDHNPQEFSILIGYTFYAVSCWGSGINHAVKAMMLTYIFKFVDSVFFHIGASNVRSQIAIGRLGAQKAGEQEVCYFGESPQLNYVYAISKAEWEASREPDV